jgi:uncharacterized phage protein (TIGR01671 family)
MREILFRGKALISRDWIYGDLRQAFDKNGKIVHFAIADQKLHYHNTIIIPETAGQFTGMTDKIGTKVFEGDILEYTDYDSETFLCTVFWDKFRFRIISELGKFDLDECYLKHAVVIGNIHDNTE